MKNYTDLRRGVLDELEWEPSIDATEIGVTARNGVVTPFSIAAALGDRFQNAPTSSAPIPHPMR
jgi:hypothetical protein